MQVNLIFPQPVLLAQIAAPDPVALARVYDHGVNTAPNVGNRTSICKQVLDEPEFLSLRQDIEHQLQIYVQEVIRPDQEFSLYITQSWLNFTTQDQYHAPHRHPNSVVSGVCYIRCDPEDCIEFHRPNIYPISIDSLDYSVLNSNTWRMNTAQNQLLLFPSTLEHSVPRRQGQGARISLSFNTWFRGTVGTEQTATLLMAP